MSDQERMECPECGEDAVNQPATDLVPWEAHGITTPAWSHQDGSSLCPIIGRSGGYEPAQPQPRTTDRAADTARLDPPATMRRGLEKEPGAEPAQPRTPQGDQRTTNLQAGTGSAIGREYMKAVIARLDVLAPRAAIEHARREPEAGA